MHADRRGYGLNSALAGSASKIEGYYSWNTKGALTGIAGEYFVAAELSRRGYVASVTLTNTKGIDIMASNMTSTHEKSKAIGIQVKANSRRRREWVLNQKAEDYS